MNEQTRIELLYQGETFSRLVDDVDAFRDDIRNSVAAGEWFWVRGDRGEGRLEPANLLVGPGIGIVIVEPYPGD
ncbi:hypothetical protein [Pseudoclavibacter helvolus]|uniref:hypothetical protein n=1 Tax=Pseudoclavibacter helvolus TaxID=255205 RepID=UPI000837E0FE|nr:hypothetical protein [Pseudoclavibacter helvolus]